MLKQIVTAAKFLLVMTILTGLIYPLFVTGLSQALFKDKANGSLITKNNVIIGSELIGQRFDSSMYFWSRPSAVDYNPLPSGASNFGPTSEKLKSKISERRTCFLSENLLKDTTLVPREMIFASASGLDPDISPEAAKLQVDRISKIRDFNYEQKIQLYHLVDSLAEFPQFHLFGNEKINVFLLNLELDKIK
jgi:potassium-transporting ATPase KdpC subunit